MMHDDPLDHAAGRRLDEAAPIASAAVDARLVLVVLVGIAAVAGNVVLVQSRSRKRGGKARPPPRPSAAVNRVIPVLTAPVVQQRDVPVWLEGLGTVSAFYTVTVKTQVDGRIDKVFFNEGQHVKKGDVLFQIDPRPFQIQLLSAQAALERDQSTLKNSQLNLDRYKTLADQKLIAVQQYTDQAATVAQLDAQAQADQAQIAAAQLNLTYARITSPIDGVTGVRLVDPGNFVQPTDTTGLVVVTQLDPIAVLFTLPEDDLPEIQKAMAQGTLSVQALSRDGDKALGEGKLSVIDNQINQATATVRLKAIFDNPRFLLWPNQFVKARLHITTHTNAIVVPAAVVQHGPQGTFAYVVNPDSTAAMRPVERSRRPRATSRSCRRDVNPARQVVVEGQAQLRPGARVATKPATRWALARAPRQAASASPALGPSRSLGFSAGRPTPG